MPAAAPIPVELQAASVRPVDRLGFTLFLAAMLHLALILGVSFSLNDPAKISKSLEITLASFKSDEPPEQVDFLAQHNQQGSDSLDEKAKLTTTEQALFQDKDVKRITPPASPPPAQVKQTQKAALATNSKQLQKTPAKAEKNQPTPASPPAVVFDSAQLSSEIASLEAELAQDIQRYAKRPKIHRLDATSTMRDKGAWYKDEWRKKIERIGNLNYPAEARHNRLYGSLRLVVSINRDGTLYEVQILQSSGYPILDQGALRIVRLAAPFAPLTGDLSDVDRLDIIRTWRFEPGDRMSSQ